MAMQTVNLQQIASGIEHHLLQMDLMLWCRHSRHFHAECVCLFHTFALINKHAMNVMHGL